MRLYILSELTFACVGYFLLSWRLTAKKAKAAQISYLVVKEQNFEGISIRVFCGYSDFELEAQAHFEEFAKKFLRIFSSLQMLFAQLSTIRIAPKKLKLLIKFNFNFAPPRINVDNSDADAMQKTVTLHAIISTKLIQKTFFRTLFAS